MHKLMVNNGWPAGQKAADTVHTLREKGGEREWGENCNWIRSDQYACKIFNRVFCSSNTYTLRKI